MKTESQKERQEPEDIVWNAITDSAKTRFDFEELVHPFDEIGSPGMAENLLFQIIAGLAVNEDEEVLAAKLAGQLMVLGLGIADGTFLELIGEIRPKIVSEIIATEVALALFRDGHSPADVLVTISSLMRGQSPGDFAFFFDATSITFRLLQHGVSFVRARLNKFGQLERNECDITLAWPAHSVLLPVVRRSYS